MYRSLLASIIRINIRPLQESITHHVIENMAHINIVACIPILGQDFLQSATSFSALLCMKKFCVDKMDTIDQLYELHKLNSNFNLTHLQKVGINVLANANVNQKDIKNRLYVTDYFHLMKNKITLLFPKW